VRKQWFRDIPEDGVAEIVHPVCVRVVVEVVIHRGVVLHGRVIEVMS
jgi:hypothetical protein